MKKLFFNIFVFLLVFNTALSEDRDFKPVAAVKDALYLLDYSSIKQGDGDEIKYIQLISYETNKNTSDGKKFKSVQMYMKGKCKEKMNLPYIMQFYDTQMDDGNVMKGNIVRTSKFVGDWEISKPGSTYEAVLLKACEHWEIIKLAEKFFKQKSKKNN